MILESQSNCCEKQRLDYIDAAKGIGMLAVILGHMGIDKLNIFLFSFHMPLFFILSGLFFRIKDNRIYTSKRAKQLLVPYIFTCVCIIILAVLRVSISQVLYGGGLLESISRSVIKWSVAGLLGSGSRIDYFGINFDFFIGAIWFLLALFWAGLIVNFLLKYKYGSILIIILGGIGLVSARFIWLPFSIQPATVGAVFILIGYELRDKLLYLKNSRVVIVCFCFWLVYLILCYLTDTQLSIASAIFPWWIIDFIGATAATICIVWISDMICRITTITKNFLVWFGRNSLIVLCFHLMELNLFPWGGVKSFIHSLGVPSPLILIIIYIAKIIFVCIAVILVHNIKVLRYVFSLESPKKLN